MRHLELTGLIVGSLGRLRSAKIWEASQSGSPDRDPTIPQICVQFSQQNENQQTSGDLLWKLGLLPFFMEVKPGNGARASVEIFVGAPDGEVDTPVVQRKGHVSDGVR